MSQQELLCSTAMTTEPISQTATQIIAQTLIGRLN